jgi:hypothetical protein
MKNRTSTMIVVAILLIAFATVVVTSTSSPKSEGASHTMPDGSSMKGDDMP